MRNGRQWDKSFVIIKQLNVKRGSDLRLPTLELFLIHHNVNRFICSLDLQLSLVVVTVAISKDSAERGNKAAMTVLQEVYFCSTWFALSLGLLFYFCLSAIGVSRRKKRKARFLPP